ncbi:MAG: alpha/beta hydrolase [Pseudomonadota bacterium]|nr:alpha/beta hydrolase [Pseudomonadota bacterium]
MKDSAWYNKEYLPSLDIPGTPDIFASWKARSLATQKRLKHVSDIPYGPNKREVMDFYPAENSKGCVVFIHGGYWVGFSKFETSFVAEGFVEQGLSVALLNYPLCPEVKIADIRTSCARAFVQLYTKVLNAAEREKIVVTGHSAGGYLAAAYLAEDWAARGLPENPIKGVVSLSGVFDVTPLIRTSLNHDLRLDEAQAKALNLISIAPRCKAKLALVVGEKESSEFHRQSSDLAKSWASLNPQVLNVAKANHFTMVDRLATKGDVLNRLAVEMVGG